MFTRNLVLQQSRVFGLSLALLALPAALVSAGTKPHAAGHGSCCTKKAACCAEKKACCKPGAKSCCAEKKACCKSGAACCAGKGHKGHKGHTSAGKASGCCAGG